MRNSQTSVEELMHRFLMIWLALLPTMARAQTFEVDFARAQDPPLVKTKFGVYQTPLVTMPRLLDSMPLLRETGVADLRYEMGWGKPESLAWEQIGGTVRRPVIDFSFVDALAARLQSAGIRPLLAMGYCPNPLKSRSEWAGWKDLPSDLASWQTINRLYAAHLRGANRPLYEVWNEPDMPEPNGKMFFGGTAQDYGQLYSHAADGISQGDPDALVGGPAAAYDLAFLAPILGGRLDFASIHGYDNYPAQLNGMRAALGGRPDVPIFLTEYASFSDLPPNGPHSRHQGAMRFFRDVKGLLAYTDVTKVYWAQWLDAGQSPGMGLVTWNGHRKAIFNAFKIYAAMPVDRCRVSPDGAQNVDALASSDAHRAAAVLWNTSTTERAVTVNLAHLPFARGTLQLSRIDATHASIIDNPLSENLETQNSANFEAGAASWSGVIPAESVIYLKAFDRDRLKPAPVQHKSVGTIVRTLYWFPKRASDAYADFDGRTWTARLGTGSSDAGEAQIGVVIDNPAPRLRLQAIKNGPFAIQNRDSLLGVRLDFSSKNGTSGKGVLWRGGGLSHSISSHPNGAIPTEIALKSLDNGRPFDIKLSRFAPANWNGTRITLTFLLRGAGRDSRAKWILTTP